VPNGAPSNLLANPLENPLGDSSAEDIIQLLDLAPHPEGGFFRETFRDIACDENGRAASTLIYFLLPAGIVSAWHRVDAVESWHFYAGAPLRLSLWDGENSVTMHVLGPHLQDGERPQFIVPKSCWQSAQTLGTWTLVGCAVAPGFTFSGFEVAPPGWHPVSSII
jgi:predicted cupin superfamily sugar epimerase